MAYSNVNNFIVILADKRDPYVSWQNHLNRGSLGGVDCVARIGTPIYAPDDCTLSNIANNGSAGNTITLKFADGWRDQMMHLSRFVPAGAKKKGQIVGYSGDSGSPGQPHVHWHRLDPSGRRRNPWDFFSSSPSGGDTKPIEEEDDMFNDDDRNRLHSVHIAVYKGGGDAGSKSIIQRLIDLETRVFHIDTQVAGADGFDNSVAERVIDIQNKVTTPDIDIDALAIKIAEQLAGKTGITKQDVIDAVKSVEWVVE